MEKFQLYWDGLYSGNTAQRRHAKFVPGGVAKTFIPTKEPELTGAADEWLARLCCFAFSVSPQPFVRMVNRATAETAQDQAASEGLAPIQNWVKHLVDDVIAAEFGAPDLEFRWKDDQAGDAAAVAQVAADYVKTGIKSVNEVRAELGLAPVAGGDAPMILTAQGPVPLSARAAGEPLARFNQNHYGPGPQGGQFAPRGEGGGGTGSGATRVSATSGGSSAKPWVGQPHEAFRQAIARLESGGQPNDGYRAHNPDDGAGPALGRYQLTTVALQQAGWKDANGAWYPATGIRSDQQFLNDPEAQERAMTDFVNETERLIDAKGLNAQIGTTFQGQRGTITVTESGLAAAALRRGPSAVAAYFQTLASAGGNANGISLSIPEQQVETRLRVFQNVPY